MTISMTAETETKIETLLEKIAPVTISEVLGTAEVVDVPSKYVLDEVKDEALILGWYNSARECRTPQCLQKLSERLLSDFKHDLGSMCHAAAAIAMAGIKVVESSDQSTSNNGLTEFQRTMIMWTIVQQITGLTDEPMRIMRFGSLLKPGGWHHYNVLSTTTFHWLQENAKTILESAPGDNINGEDIKHLKGLVNGKLPKGFVLEREAKVPDHKARATDTTTNSSAGSAAHSTAQSAV